MRLALHALSILGLALSTAHALDLTPQHGVRQGNEGPPTPVIQFTDGDKIVTYRPPPDWQPSGEANSVTFFTADPAAGMKLQIIAKSAQPKGTASESPQELQEWAAKFIPAGSRDVEFVKVVPSPFNVGRHDSTEFIFNYSPTSARSSISISVIDLNDKERLMVLIYAKTKDFEQIRALGIASMFSWAFEG